MLVTQKGHCIGHSVTAVRIGILLLNLRSSVPSVPSAVWASLCLCASVVKGGSQKNPWANQAQSRLFQPIQAPRGVPFYMASQSHKSLEIKDLLE
jgi:hypothetical protein